jgi:CubicO group peptidase (beta-lactamase class C family)
MTARDWANFGQFLMTQKQNKTCLGEFFNEGVKVAVDTVKSNNSKYGYQSWVFDVNNTPTMVLQGHGGQFMVLDEQNETILLILSKNENYEKGNLFKDIANFAERLN